MLLKFFKLLKFSDKKKNKKDINPLKNSTLPQHLVNFKYLWHKERPTPYEYKICIHILNILERHYDKTGTYPLYLLDSVYETFRENIQLDQYFNNIMDNLDEVDGVQ